MDSTTTPAFFLLLLSIITIYHIGFGTALHVEVYPEKVNELIDSEVNITCHFCESTDWDGNLILVELGKEGEHPSVVLRNAELTYGPGRKMNVKAEGRIVKDSTQSFLRLTISDPGAGDAGTYSCSVFYTDGFGVMKESKVEAHVIVDNDDDKVVLVHLLKKMSDLEKTADTQDKLLKDHDAQTKIFKKDMQDQQDNTKVLETKLKSQQNNTNVLKNTVAQQKKELKDQHDNTKVLEKQLKNQQDKTNALEKELKDQQEKMNTLEKTVVQQEKQLEDQRANETVTIAFSYYYNGSDKLVYRQPMLFRNKIMSIGDAYDPQSGVFTAPRDGLYVFHVLVTTFLKNEYIYIHLQANGNELARLYVQDSDHEDQSSVSSVTSLKAGDQVQPLVGYISGTTNKPWPGYYSTFTGYLLRSL